MKYAEINERFTKLVGKYILHGYVINTSTMGGSQGEIAKVDLTNGKEIIRIAIDNFYFTQVGLDRYYYDGVEITVRKALDRLTPNTNNTAPVLWNDNCEIIFSEKHFEIDRRNNWYGTKDMAQWQKSVQRIRSGLSFVKKDKHFGDAAKKIVLPFIKRQPNCKSVKLSDIEDVYKEYSWNHSERKIEAEYIVVAKGRRYCLS